MIKTTIETLPIEIRLSLSNFKHDILSSFADLRENSTPDDWVAIKGLAVEILLNIANSNQASD